MPVNAQLKVYRRHKKREQQSLYRKMKTSKLRQNHFQLFCYLYRYRLIVISIERLQEMFFPAEPDNLHNLHQAITEIRKRLKKTGYELVNYHAAGKQRATLGYSLVPYKFEPVFFRKNAS
jgi:DNA-binding winged helix-turn-helix (wHTH) protein